MRISVDMEYVDVETIMGFGPCPAWPEGRVREAVPQPIPLTDLLRAAHIRPSDRLWVALRPGFVSDRALLRLFACKCAGRALLREREAGREPDRRSWEAVAVARRYAHGEAADAELAVAETDAWAAARAARAAGGGRAAARAAAEATTVAAADAAADAARADACAAGADADAAWADAWDAARTWQCDTLAKMLEER